MLKQLKKSKGEGFTIIEVMIVLAIAGLILLIVFLAVPALQRTGRNTQRKNDAANVSSAIAAYQSNNNGALPNGFGTNASGLDVCKAGGAAAGVVNAACGAGNTESSKMGFYASDHVYVTTAGTGGGAPSTVAPGSEGVGSVSTESIQISLKEKCGDTNNGVYSSRSAAIWYVTESNTGNGSLQCTDS